MSGFDYNNDYSGGHSGGGFNNDGGSQEARDEKTQQRQSLTPVTIKQIGLIQIHPDNTFELDGCDIQQVKFVGSISTIQDAATSLTYKLEDGTGSIEARKWVSDVAEEDQEESGAPKLEINRYARVTGNVRSYQDRVQVVIEKIVPVEDHNEVLYHLLEAAAVHAERTHAPTAASRASRAHDEGQLFVGGEGGEGGEDGRIVEFLRGEQASGNGEVHVNAIARGVTLGSERVLAVLERLVEAGEVYNTLDDYHFALT